MGLLSTECIGSKRAHQGFTLIELMVTLAILAILATLVVPVAQLNKQRQQEQELRLALHEIRNAIDAYKKASDEGRIRKEAGTTGYPKTLDLLVEGVDDRRSPKQEKIFFLRRLPRDPFFSDPSIPSSATWGLRSYASDASDPQEGDDVYDVYTRTSRIALNGTALKDW